MKRCCSVIISLCSMALFNTLQMVHAQTAAPSDSSRTPQLQQRLEPSPQLQNRPQIPAEQRNQLVLDVVATDKTGKPLMGLRPDDFELFDNKKSVAIEHFQSTTSNDNTQILIVIDAINNSPESLSRTEGQVKSFLRMNGGHLARPISILILSDSKPVIRSGIGHSADSTTAALPSRQAFVRRIPPSTDGSALIQAIDQNVIALSRISEAQGAEGDTERVQLSVQALDAIGTAETKVDGHKIVIWLSPGWPRFARSYAKTRTALFDNVIYFSELMRDARITLDFINPDGVHGSIRADPSPPQTASQIAFKSPAPPAPTVEAGPDWYEAYYAAVKKPNQADVNDLALQVLAHQSGGLVLSKDNEIASLIARCVNEAPASYTISYDSSPVSGSDAYHELEIKLRAAGGLARVRRGYYAK